MFSKILKCPPIVINWVRVLLWESFFKLLQIIISVLSAILPSKASSRHFSSLNISVRQLSFTLTSLYTVCACVCVCVHACTCVCVCACMCILHVVMLEPLLICTICALRLFSALSHGEGTLQISIIVIFMGVGGGGWVKCRKKQASNYLLRHYIQILKTFKINFRKLSSAYSIIHNETKRKINTSYTTYVDSNNTVNLCVVV